MRLDIFLAKHHNLSRNKAQALIETGLISVNGTIIRKPSFEVLEHANIQIQDDRRVHWVSRSAEKLEGFIELLESEDYKFGISGSLCLDVGSSTGGFTQVLLEHGAKRVDAVDVGTDQLHETIRTDIRVYSYEKTDIREFKQIHGKEIIYDIIVCDASFISLTIIFSSIIDLASCDTQIILLWKPQFEVGSSNLRKTGIPKNEKIILQKQREWESFIASNNCKVLQKEKSSLIGEAGNQEWVYLIRKI